MGGRPLKSQNASSKFLAFWKRLHEDEKQKKTIGLFEKSTLRELWVFLC